jgi:hypothetical protein
MVSLVCLTLAAGAARIAADDQWPLTNETAAERLERLKQLSPAEKDELARKKGRFDKLPAAEKTRLRTLHANLVEHEQGAQLHVVATRYAQWLRTLPAGERAELLSLPPEQRLERIRKMKQQQQYQQIRELVHTHLEKEDVEAVRTWLGEYVDAHKKELFEMLSSEMQQRMRHDPDGTRRRVAMFWAMSGRFGGPPLPPPTDAEIERLRGKLSTEARQALDSVDTADKKLRLAAHWFRAAIWTRMRTPQVSREELAEFFANELDAKRRAELEKLPPEQFDQQLKWEYRLHHFRNSPGKHRHPFFRGPAGRFGRFRGDHGGSRPPGPPGPPPIGSQPPRFAPPPRDGEQHRPPRGAPHQPPASGGWSSAARS